MSDKELSEIKDLPERLQRMQGILDRLNERVLFRAAMKARKLEFVAMNEEYEEIPMSHLPKEDII